MEAEGLHAEYNKLAGEAASALRTSSFGDADCARRRGGRRQGGGRVRPAREAVPAAGGRARPRRAGGDALRRGARRERRPHVKYCTLEMPAVGIHLKGVEARRARCSRPACSALEAITEHSTSLATAAVERQGQAATHRAREAEWGLEAAI